MATKGFLIVCTLALFTKVSLSQYINAMYESPGIIGPYGVAGNAWPLDGLLCNGLPGVLPGRTWAYDDLVPDAIRSGRVLGCGGPLMDFTPTTGGALPVTSASAIPPTGICILSENVYDGILAVVGEVPFVGTTGMDGIMPTLGVGAINYGCGNGLTAMVSEPGPISSFTPGAAFSPIAFGPNAGLLSAPAVFSANFNPTLSLSPSRVSPGFGCGCLM